MQIFAILIALAFAQPPVPPLPPPPVPDGSPTLTLPAEILIAVGDLREVKAETTGKQVRWESSDPKGLIVTPPKATDTRIWIVGVKPGVYNLLAVTAAGDMLSEFSRVKVTVEGPAPPVPPKPPEPPIPPTPPAPNPSDILVKKLAAAYASDAAPAAFKNAQRIALIGVYYAMADHASDVSDKKIATLEALQSDMVAIRKQLVADTALVGVRKVVAEYIAEQLGSDPKGSLTDSLRAQAVSMYGILAKSLESVK